MWEKTYFDWSEATDSVSKMYQRMFNEQAYEKATKVEYINLDEVKLLV